MPAEITIGMANDAFDVGATRLCAAGDVRG